MSSDDEIEKLKRRRLCLNCVGEAFLKSEIEAKGKRRKCNYCGEMAQSYSIDDMGGKIEKAFDEHYVRTADEPDSYQSAMLRDEDSTYDWEREGEPAVYAIMNAADIPEEAASDIQQVLEDKFSDFDTAAQGLETEFDSEAYYEEKDSEDSFWQGEWRRFELSLKTQARFFNQEGARHLASIFDGIDTMRTRDGRTMLVDANVVLFHKAARVEAIDLPVGTKVRADFGFSTEEGWETDYSVVELRPKEETKTPLPNELDDLIMFDAETERPSGAEHRVITLRVDLQSLRVHIIGGVTFDTADYSVSRSRREFGDVPF
jgi:hypothetical protein